MTLGEQYSLFRRLDRPSGRANDSEWINMDIIQLQIEEEEAIKLKDSERKGATMVLS